MTLCVQRSLGDSAVLRNDQTDALPADPNTSSSTDHSFTILGTAEARYKEIETSQAYKLRHKQFFQEGWNTGVR